jgi:predicted metal-dependent phosphoesterase TrpH
MRNGVKTLAITDHDSMMGYVEALEVVELEKLPLNLIPGVELDCIYPEKDQEPTEMHMLGYYVDAGDSDFRTYLVNTRKERLEYFAKVVKALSDKLPKKYMKVLNRDYEQRCEPVEHWTINRSDIASILVKEKLVGDAKEARVFMKKATAGLAERHKPLAYEVIEVIAGAGGIPVLAHPEEYGRNDIVKIIGDLHSKGLLGLEVWHPSAKGKSGYYAGLAKRQFLTPTGGSDYHGHGGGRYIADVGNYTTPEGSICALLQQHEGFVFPLFPKKD